VVVIGGSIGITLDDYLSNLCVFAMLEYTFQVVNLNYKTLVAYYILKLHNKKLQITLLKIYTLILKNIN